jgi:hypothetical protein
LRPGSATNDAIIDRSPASGATICSTPIAAGLSSGEWAELADFCH